MSSPFFPVVRVLLAEPTGFEPATSDVTGRRSNQLNYDSALELQIAGAANATTPLYDETEYRQKHHRIARKPGPPQSLFTASY